MSSPRRPPHGETRLTYEYDMEWHMRHQRGPTEPSPAVIEQWFTEFYRLVDEHCPVGAQARLRTWASVFRGILQPRTEA